MGETRASTRRADRAAILRAGGILGDANEVPIGERTSTVRARRYTHPAVPGRLVVRLCADVIAPGADAEMTTLGFAAPAVSEPLGQSRFRALGFPAWALVHHPEHARFALEVMQELKSAAARARTKPGRASEAFAAVADRLGRSVPHFLPSFWEEAGRAFLAHENTALAAQCFEKARQAEKIHALTVDEELRADVFLEFALAGALTVKSLSGYGRELERRFGAKEAYPRFVELAVRRTLGGLPPWTGMGKELRALAKAAGLDGAREDLRLLTTLLDAAAIARAPRDFWTTYRTAVVQAAARSEELRRRLLHLFPTPAGARTAGELGSWWLDLLKEVKAPELLAGGTAAWLARALAYTQDDPRLVDLLEQLAPRLIDEGIPLEVVRREHFWRSTASLELCERALELGVPVTDPRGVQAQSSNEASPFDLASGVTVDPVRTAADPRFTLALERAVAAAMGVAAVEASSRNKPALAGLRRAWLARKIEELGSGLVGMSAALGALSAARTAFAASPELLEALAASSPARALGRVLRAGLYAEFTWPALDSVVAELKAAAITVHGAFPYAVVSDGVRAVVVGPEGKALEHDLRLRPELGGTLRHAVFVGGQLLVVGGSRKAYWSARPAEVFVVEGNPSTPTGVVLGDGSTTFGGRKVLPGDTAPDLTGQVVGDGTGLWARRREHFENERLVELDPETGKVGRASWPSVIERSLRPGEVVTEVFLLPAPAGTERAPTGWKDGLVGCWTVRSGEERSCVTVDGVRRAVPPWSRKFPQVALVTMPGASTPLALLRGVNWGGKLGHRLVDGDHAVGDVDGESAYATGGTLPVPVPFWSYFVPRDRTGSDALRQLDDRGAERLLAAAREDGDAVAEVLPAVTSDRLKAAIAASARTAAKLEERLGELVADIHASLARATTSAEESSPNAAEDGFEVRDVEDALPHLADHATTLLVRERGDLRASIDFVSRWLSGGDVESSKGMMAGFRDWSAWLGSIRAVATLLSTPAVALEGIPVLVRLLRTWQASRLARDPSTLLTGVLFLATGSSLQAKETPGGAALDVIDGTRIVARRFGSVNGVDWMRFLASCGDGGVVHLPAGATLDKEIRPAPADDAAWLGRFLAELDARGAPPAWSVAPVEALARQTGLTHAEATLLWAGLPNLRKHEHDFLGKELRATLGLTAKEAAPAVDGFRKLSHAVILSLYAAAAPDEPSLLWTDPAAVAARLGRVWTERFGAKASLRADIVAAIKSDLKPALPAASLLRALLTPDEEECMRLEPTKAIRNAPSSGFDRLTVKGAVELLPYLFDLLPVGDPYRAALPSWLEATRVRLASPGLLLLVGWQYYAGADRPKGLALLETVGGAKASRPEVDPSTLVRDTGALLLTLEAGGYLSAWLRPSGYLAGDRRQVEQVASLLFGYGQDMTQAIAAIRFLLSPAATAFTDRVRVTPVPEGKYEANPALSAPAIFAAARARLLLSDDATTLYLQVLTLLDPSAKRVRLWNEWDAARLKAASAELLARELVVEGKREGSGREVFLPGGWDKPKRLEMWKRPLYGRAVDDKGPLGLPRPHHQLFEAAWQRIVAGDMPALEDIRR